MLLWNAVCLTEYVGLLMDKGIRLEAIGAQSVVVKFASIVPTCHGVLVFRSWRKCFLRPYAIGRHTGHGTHRVLLPGLLNHAQ